MIYFLLALVPMLIPFFAKYFFKTEFTIPEMILACVAPSIVIALIYIGGTYNEMADTEVLSGQVVKKERKEVSCRHSYSCHCYTYYTGSGKNRTSHRRCKTCYDHRYDVDWNVMSTLGDVSIPKEDRQGLVEPKRWSVVNVGDPYATTSSYINYVKGAKDSLFNLEKYTPAKLSSVPEYPGNIYDIYKIDRVVDIGAGVSNIRQLNDGISNILTTLGKDKQVNIVMAVTTQPRDYAYIIRDKWLGGKKNDVIITVGSKHYPKVDWVEVFSWSKEPMVNITLRDDLQSLGDMSDVNQVMAVIAKDVGKHYVRKPMKEFEYLEGQIQPSGTVIFWALFIGTFVSFCLTLWGIKSDVFGNERRY